MVGLLIGFAVAAVFGVVIGMLMGRYKKLEMALDSVVNAAYVTPHVAFIPIIILWFGLGLEAKIFIVSTSAIFPVLINTQSGVRDVSKLLVEVGEAFVANPRQIFFKIVIPASLPFIMAGLRLAIGRALTSVIVADFFTAMTGLGGVILQASTLLRVSNMLAAVLVVMIVGVSLTELVKFGEARFAPWKETERATR
ncbi:MAG: ABC transporter permease [Dehalococcoidia bacterium]|nr:ABC transporter permease [Dehalococcoidia bacterium]